MKILTCEQTRALEKKAVQLGCTYRGLMEQAGKQAAGFLQKKLPGCRNKTVVLCGNGNNGGDGFVVARLLAGWTKEVQVVLLNGEPKTGDALEMYRLAKLEGSIGFCSYDSPAIAEKLRGADIIVDAIYGIGFHGSMKEGYFPLLDLVKSSGAKVVSLDLPSGISCDSGEVEGRAVEADYTVTFSALKFSQVQVPAMDYCGEIAVADVGVPKQAYEESEYAAETTGAWALEGVLRPRKRNTNKGSYGTLLCVCGSRGMAGAAMLCGKAASRCGVGLVDMALPESIYPIAAGAVPEAVYTLFPEDRADILLSDAKHKLHEKFQNQRTTACLVGCGLGCTALTVQLMEAILQQCRVPLVIDADGLNILSVRPDLLKAAGVPVILTPHPGEMARLLKTTVEDVQRHRVEYARDFAVTYKMVVALKGANTVVAWPNGEIYVNLTGNPGLAKAGSGDVLAGMIASLLAQGLAPEHAAAGGVYLHGLAGDRCAGRLSQISMTASDLIDELPELFLNF